MARRKRIRTPLRHRVRRFYLAMAPLIVFSIAVLATGALWYRHSATPTLVGAAQAIRYDVGSPGDGLLSAVGGRTIEQFDAVREGEVIARLDDLELMAELVALQKELPALSAQLDATQATIQQQRADRDHDHMDQARRLAVDAERLRLDVLDRRRDIETDRILLERLEVELAATRAAHQRQAETDFGLDVARLNRDEIERRIAASVVTLGAAEDELQDAQVRSERQPRPADPFTEEQLAPVRAAIAAHEARIDVARAAIAQLTVRAPADGMIAAVYARPGQAVTAGTPLMVLASARSEFVIAYLPERRTTTPVLNEMVQLRPHGAPHDPVDGIIERIGAQIEPVPPHQRRDPTRPQWGLPIRVSVPAGTLITAGELVDVSMQPAAPERWRRLWNRVTGGNEEDTS